MRLASTRAFQAPAWARALAPPPPKTATTLMIADWGLRIADWKCVRRIRNPKSAIRNCSFPSPRRIPPIHHSPSAPFGSPIVASLLVRRLGHDRGDFRRHAFVVERHVGHVTGVRV